MSAPTIVEIDGREVKLTNLDKVLYPSGFTKAEVIDYFVRVAPTAMRAPRGPVHHVSAIPRRC